MIRGRFRQIARLESLAAAYLTSREKADSGFEQSVRENSLVHTANLSALILYGKPKIDEPLSLAWRRCLDSVEWQKRREKYGGWDEYGRDTCGDPFVSHGATRIAKYFRDHFLPDLPGADEVEKFSLIFKKAPPWLLWFTYADANARILGIKLPDLSAVSGYIRDPKNFGNDRLPPGPFECRLRTEGTEDLLVRSTDFLMRKKRKNEPNNATPRERKRLRRIHERYETVRKPLSDQKVVTKLAELALLTRISGFNHFARYFEDC